MTEKDLLLRRSGGGSFLGPRGPALLLAAGACFVLVAAGAAFAEDNARGLNMEALLAMMRNFVMVMRLIMMFVVVIWGFAIGLLMHLGEQNAKRALSEYFMSAFFVFCSTAIADAILAVTIGKFTLK